MNEQLLRTLFAWSGHEPNPLPAITSISGGRTFVFTDAKAQACLQLCFCVDGTVQADKRTAVAGWERSMVETPAELIDLLEWVKS